MFAPHPTYSRWYDRFALSVSNEASGSIHIPEHSNQSEARREAHPPILLHMVVRDPLKSRSQESADGTMQQTFD